MIRSRLFIYIVISITSLLISGCGLIGFIGGAEEEVTDMEGDLPEWLLWSHYDSADPDSADDSLPPDEEGSSANGSNIIQETTSTAPAPAIPSFPVTDPEPEEGMKPPVPSGGGHKPGTMEYIIWLHEQRKQSQKEQEAPVTERRDWWE